MLKENNFGLRILYLAKLLSKWKDKIKIFSYIWIFEKFTIQRLSLKKLH